ncbi:PREDICTED: putative F-box/LRR-repeat protein At3g44080 [Camelina sativa]|uniref:F-box/LRR-repeat protein At3g44080 n=1 Tax=Camelina sativa TaxID=90675 RepID=A0ABM0YX03_CAMSA|nr:PREDICTED: putative F-box/LRR-repeat protein At3g44080 [Camelina sativa]
MEHGEQTAELQLYPASLDCLPDDLLLQILSFLTTKEAASTSVLSKRWRTLFALSPNLDFDNSIFLHPEEGKRNRPDIQRSFEDFVDKTLALHDDNHIIKTFSLKFDKPDRDRFGESFGVMDVVDRWICNAFGHVVSELHLRIPSNSHCDLPSKVFTSTTLVKLSLGTAIYVPSVPSHTCLPSLKVLLLESVQFRDNQLSDVVVDLYFSGYAGHTTSHYNLDSLGKATLDLHLPKHYKYLDTVGEDLMNLISGIRNLKTLHLTFSAVEAISLFCKDGLPVFNELVELAFSSQKRGWKVLLPLLLERSPNLETLILSGLHRYTLRTTQYVGIQVPSNNQIKILHIIQYQGRAIELLHINHFLLHMECLEVLKVYVAAEMDDFKKMQVMEDMLKLPAASSKLKIQVK